MWRQRKIKERYSERRKSLIILALIFLIILVDRETENLKWLTQGGECEKRKLWTKYLQLYITISSDVFRDWFTRVSVPQSSRFRKMLYKWNFLLHRNTGGMRLIRLNGGSMPCPISEIKRTGGSKEDISVNTFLCYVQEDRY